MRVLPEFEVINLPVSYVKAGTFNRYPGYWKTRRICHSFGHFFLQLDIFSVIFKRKLAHCVFFNLPVVLRIRIRVPVFFWPLDPGWKKIQIWDEHPRSYFWELSISLKKHFWVKNTSSLMWIRIQDPWSCQPRILNETNRILDPGSATLSSSTCFFF
jgi:hypothetical protein